MFVYIARHAWAGERGDPRCPDDSQRPLTDEGIARYERLVQGLVNRGFAPQQVVTSPYIRCRQTADIISQLVPRNPPVAEMEELEPGSYLEPVIDWTNTQGGSDICWVGHSPDVERFTAALVGDNSASIRFAKGAVAAIAFDDEVFAGGGELYWLATAKLLGV